MQPSHCFTNKPLDLSNAFLPGSLSSETLKIISTPRRRMMLCLSYHQTWLFLSSNIVLTINWSRLKEAETKPLEKVLQTRNQRSRTRNRDVASKLMDNHFSALLFLLWVTDTMEIWTKVRWARCHGNQDERLWNWRVSKPEFAKSIDKKQFPS